MELGGHCRVEKVRVMDVEMEVDMETGVLDVRVIAELWICLRWCFEGEREAEYVCGTIGLGLMGGERDVGYMVRAESGLRMLSRGGYVNGIDGEVEMNMRMEMYCASFWFG